MTNFELCETKFGVYLLHKIDLVSSTLKGNYFWEDEVLPVFDSLTADMVVIEVGSYIGDHTVYLSSKCKKVYAFEANTLNYYQLCANLLLNNCINVEPYNRCIGATISTAKLSYIAENNYAGTVYKADHTGTIPVHTLDSILLEELEQLDLIKTDMEGMDLDGLLGAKGLIEKFKPDIIFEYNEYHSSQDFEEYTGYLENLGYNILKLGVWNHHAKYNSV